MALFTQPNQHGVKGLKKVLYTIAGSSVVVKNLRAYLIAQGVWDGVKPIDLTITITGSVWSNDKAVAAIAILAADFPTAMKIRLDNAGLICGKGDWPPAGGALFTNRPIIVTNTGNINGGGYNAAGAGGNTCSGVAFFPGSGETPPSCGSECSSGAGSTGYGYGFSSAASPASYGGAGSICGGSAYLCNCGEYNCDTCYCVTCPGGGGGIGGGAGSGGYAVSGNAFITWVATGTRNGAIG